MLSRRTSRLFSTMSRIVKISDGKPKVVEEPLPDTALPKHALIKTSYSTINYSDEY